MHSYKYIKTPFVKLNCNLFLFRILCSGILDTVVVVRFEVSGTHFEECYVITVLCYMT